MERAHEIVRPDGGAREVADPQPGHVACPADRHVRHPSLEAVVQVDLDFAQRGALRLVDRQRPR
eukprot:1322099-Pleurochrysis_carterae.AAC.1